MEIPDKLFETILLAVGETAEEVKNENITANETPEIYKKQCEKLACFSELAKDNKTKQALEAREKAKAGEWFRLKELPKVIRHFYLVDAIEHRDSVVEKSILFALLCFLGGQYSYAQEKILNLMKLGAQLFLSASKSGRYSSICKPRGPEEDEKLLVRAVQILKQHGVQVSVQKGTTVINDEDEKKIQIELEKKIEAYGGLKFLQELFLAELAPKYDAELGRYMVYRGKTALGHVPRNLKSRIPYQYLIQLALKHLSAPKYAVGYPEQSFQEIIEYGAAYLETLQLQGYSVAEDMFCEMQDLSKENYFCLDARMAGYGFYEVLYQILFEKMGNGLSRKQGKLLEKLLYGMFRKKKIPYLAGKYQAEGDLPERDCDMILDGKDKSMFLEIKKCPLPQSYETMDDVDVFKTLGKGLFYAQEQILAHRLRLKRKGMIALYDEQGKHLTDYKISGKRVFSVSICMPEYDFFNE